MLIHVYIYICIPVYCLYIVYKYLGMTPSGTIVVLLLFFIFLVFPCFILLFVLVICAFFHICMFLMGLSLLIKNLNLNLLHLLPFLPFLLLYILRRITILSECHFVFFYITSCHHHEYNFSNVQHHAVNNFHHQLS